MVEAISTGLFDAFVSMLPEIVDCVKIALGVEAHDKKLKKTEIKKAMDLDKDFCISDELHNDIDRMSKGSLIMKVAFNALAARSGKLVLYTLYYLSDPNAKKLSFDEEDRAFINGVAYFAGVGKIYDNADTIDIREYDSRFGDFNYDKPYLLSIDNLSKKVMNEEFRAKMAAKMGMCIISDSSVPWLTGTVNGVNGRVDQDGLIHPIFFTPVAEPRNYNKLQSDLISQTTFSLLDEAFRPYFFEDDHYYFATNADGAYTLNIIREDAMGAVDSYIVDDGSILGGNRVSILASFINPNTNAPDTIFLTVKDNPDIVATMLNNRFYTLSPLEVMGVVQSFFNNTVIYHNIDFSNTAWYDSLNSIEKEVLEKKLSKILPHIEDARMRFSTFSSIDSFSLVSDYRVKSQLKGDGTTSSKIIEGMTIMVSGGSAEIFVNGKSTKISLV